MHTSTRQLHNRKAGFSLVEVLVLVVVLAIIGAAAGRALQNLAATPVKSDQAFQIETRLISKMEEIRAMSFDNLAVAAVNSTLSDIVTISGKDYQRTVAIALADANGDGLVDATFKQITVTCGGQSVTTYVTR